MTKQNPFNLYTKKSVKEAVEYYEWKTSGLSQESGTYATAKKLRFMTGQQIIDERLDSEKDPNPDIWYCLYNITLGNDMEKKRTQYDDCWLSFEKIRGLLVLKSIEAGSKEFRSFICKK